MITEANRVALLEREIHDLRQQLIRKEAELVRAERHYSSIFLSN
jgi:hypothetical protein